MTFKDWLFETGDFVNPYYAGQWKTLHILTLLLVVISVIILTLVANKSKRANTKKRILFILSSLIIFFEICQRVIYFIRLYHFNVVDMQGLNAFWIIIPKPWCAVACWLMIAAPFVNKKFFYNFASISGLLCTLVFFAYPGVGFNNEYIMFSNLYSIVTHSLLLISSIYLITTKFTSFKYKEIWKVAICFLLTFIYGLLEIFVFKTFDDPMYFMPDGDIQANILKISYSLYIILYILVIIIFINIFYFIGDRKNLKKFLNNKNNKA